MRFKVERGSFVPAGATKVADKSSDAVAYVYVRAGNRPAAMVFIGRKVRPYWHRVYRTDLARERDIASLFESRRQAAHRDAERRAEAAKPHGLEVGHVLVSSWGYDQTNIDWFQVTAVVGRCMVEVRPIGSADAGTGREPWATGKSMPNLDAFKGEAIRRRVHGQHRSVRIDEVRTAHVWDGRPANWTAYA